MRIKAVPAGLAVAAAAVVGLAAPAAATEKDGNCEIGSGTGELCVLDVNGQTADFQNPDADHGDDVFLPNGGTVLNSPLVCCVRNADTTRFALVYSGVNFTGALVVVAPNTFANPPPGGTGSNDWQ